MAQMLMKQQLKLKHIGVAAAVLQIICCIQYKAEYHIAHMYTL